MDGVAGRLLAVLTAVMPPSRRAWGRAMIAELDYALAATAPGVIPLLALAGAVLAPLGAIADRQLVLARARRSCVPHPEQIR